MMTNEPQVTPPPPVMQPGMMPPPPVQLPDGSQGISNAQPVWQFVLLSICSFGIYDVVWFYRNWHLLKRERNLKVTPLARAIFSGIFCFSFFDELDQLTERRFAWPMPTVFLAACYLILSVVTSVLNRLSFQYPDNLALDLGGIIGLLLTILVLIPAVSALNSYWATAQPGHRVRTGLSGGAIAVVIVGGLLWLMVIAGMMMPAE